MGKRKPLTKVEKSRLKFNAQLRDVCADARENNHWYPRRAVLLPEKRCPATVARIYQEKFVSQVEGDDVTLAEDYPRICGEKGTIVTFTIEDAEVNASGEPRSKRKRSEKEGRRTLTIQREALHSSDWDDARVDTTEKLKGLVRAHRVLSTDYTDEGERSIRQNGEAISHAGVRSRFKAPCASERTTSAAVCKAGCEDDYKAVLADVQTVANRGILVAAQWAPDAMASQVAELQGLWKGGGTASWGHQSASLGYKAGAAVHLDRNDARVALWICLGGQMQMFLPEAGVILDLYDGDVLTFDSATMWHCLMGVPDHALGSVSDNICVSMYVNRNQIAELKRLKAATEGPKLSAAELAQLSPYEQERYERMRRHHEFKAQLGLV